MWLAFPTERVVASERREQEGCLMLRFRSVAPLRVSSCGICLKGTSCQRVICVRRQLAPRLHKAASLWCCWRRRRRAWWNLPRAADGLMKSWMGAELVFMFNMNNSLYNWGEEAGWVACCRRGVRPAHPLWSSNRRTVLRLGENPRKVSNADVWRKMKRQKPNPPFKIKRSSQPRSHWLQFIETLVPEHFSLRRPIINQNTDLRFQTGFFSLKRSCDPKRKGIFNLIILRHQWLNQIQINLYLNSKFLKFRFIH